MTKENRILEEVNRSIISLMTKEPFYAHLFSTINKYVGSGSNIPDTMGIGIFDNKFLLYINSDFWDNILIDPNHRIGIIKHEILHLIFKHPLAKLKGKNRMLCYVAMDMAVNQYIEKECLPEGRVHIEDYAIGNCYLGRSWEFYYNLLLENNDDTEDYLREICNYGDNSEKNDNNNNGSGNENEENYGNNDDDGGSKIADTGEENPGDDAGIEGLGEKETKRETEKERETETHSNKLIKALKKLMTRTQNVLSGNFPNSLSENDYKEQTEKTSGKEVSENIEENEGTSEGDKEEDLEAETGTGENKQKFTGIEAHDYWQEINNMPDAEKNLLETKLDDYIKKTYELLKDTKHYGSIPGQVRETIDSTVLLPTSILWQREIRMFSAQTGKTRLQNTMKRPSKRFGTTPGVRVIRDKQMLVAIDTSGSIENHDLIKFFSEIYYLWKTGVKIHVVECDVKIGREYDYKGVTPNSLSGGGGTSFNEPVKYLNNGDFDGLIYITDGYGSISIKPRKSVLWVLNSSQNLQQARKDFSYLPGRIILINS